MQKKVGRWIQKIVVCLLLFFIVLPTNIHGEESKVVRVGLYLKDGYHTVDEDGAHRGFGYEYLQRVASYTGWTYEYVEGTLNECIKMLENGEIDLITGIQKTDKRIGKMNFSSSPTIYASICILQNSKGTVSYDDFESFNGKTIGTLAGSSINEDLAAYAEHNNFTYQEKEYPYSSDVLEALDKGEIDFACLVNNQNLGDARVVSQFGAVQFYYATSLARIDLLPDLNNAIIQIQRNNQAFLSDIYSKYYNSSSSIAFTKEEQAFIDEQKKIEVALYLDVGELFCHYDKHKQAYAGLAVDTMKLISKRTGLHFEYHEIPKGTSPLEYANEHPDEIIAPTLINSLVITSGKCVLFDPIIKGRMMAVTHDNSKINSEDSMRLVVPEDLLVMNNVLSQYFPNAKIISVDNHDECMAAVENGKADIALVNEMTGNYESQSPFYEDLQLANVAGINEDMTIALGNNSNPLLVSILKKAIGSITDRDTRQLVLNNTASTSYVMSNAELLYKYRYALGIAIVFGIWLFALIVSFDKSKRQQQKENEALLLAQERNKADKKYQDVLFRQANFDRLTGLYNQSHFYEVVDHMMSNHPEETYIFYHFNLEKFSLINDIYGFDAGDAVLCGIRDILQAEIGNKGVYSRLYADQFAVCIAKSCEIHNALTRNTVRYLNYHGQKIRVQMNVGVYERKDVKFTASECSDFANLSLREGSRVDDEHVSVYNDLIHEKLRMNQRITNSMEDALKNGEFQVYYQAQVDIRYGSLVGGEALIRWVKPDNTVIPPNVFIPVFEGNRFIYQVDCYVCEQVCKQLSIWRKLGKIVPISINLSRIDLEEPDLIPMLLSNLRKYDIPVEYLHLEITESMYVQDEENTFKVICNLRDKGFVVEMDDFGSGYSSLNMLKDMPIDVLKLDMGFFKGENHVARGGNIVEFVVKMAHSMGIIVIAEGVEKTETVDFLQSIHCCIVQGYLYGKPEPAEIFEKRLRSSALGMKMVEIPDDDSVSNLYWKIEALSNLMKDYDIQIMDYDPIYDFAKIVYTDADGNRQEISKLKYLENLPNNRGIHPEYKELMYNALKGKGPEPIRFDFLGRFNEEYNHSWYTAIVHYYFDENKKIRVIVTVCPKKDH